MPASDARKWPLPHGQGQLPDKSYQPFLQPYEVWQATLPFHGLLYILVQNHVPHQFQTDSWGNHEHVR